MSVVYLKLESRVVSLTACLCDRRFGGVVAAGESISVRGVCRLAAQCHRLSCGAGGRNVGGREGQRLQFSHPAYSSADLIGLPQFLYIFYLLVRLSFSSSSIFFVSFPPSSLNGTQPKPATCSEVSAICSFENVCPRSGASPPPTNHRP